MIEVLALYVLKGTTQKQMQVKEDLKLILPFKKKHAKIYANFTERNDHVNTCWVPSQGPEGQLPSVHMPLFRTTVLELNGHLRKLKRR